MSHDDDKCMLKVQGHVIGHMICQSKLAILLPNYVLLGGPFLVPWLKLDSISWYVSYDVTYNIVDLLPISNIL